MPSDLIGCPVGWCLPILVGRLARAVVISASLCGFVCFAMAVILKCVRKASSIAELTLAFLSWEMDGENKRTQRKGAESSHARGTWLWSMVLV